MDDSSRNAKKLQQTGRESAEQKQQEEEFRARLKTKLLRSCEWACFKPRGKNGSGPARTDHGERASDTQSIERARETEAWGEMWGAAVHRRRGSAGFFYFVIFFNLKY